ncbi:hypothetical protein BABINDRAFT_160896 [Babjeviella inositovora NRRL Y-12698]|uniref:DNA damage response protein kinase DUN1 n=1 Tax=Babjeviella inositovora NRRL Y-12698 TaxID=984486 RepID=A0A1E3QSH9_9ASCO|nr:uncharacterized protein BABINDRAFT_160896 [Babjeviella inositovora NRRL Y-12698]ODQ80649.1 hypothetical protein BABINDRAFT_160896 [Babjeviella inositovora NRRL Y-12698]
MLNRKRHISGDVSTPKRSNIPTNPVTPLATLFSMTASPDLTISRDNTLIGRSSQCDIKLSGPDISGKHCHFAVVRADGREYLSLTDLSSHGTFVNGELLGNVKQRVLQNGDKIAFAQSGSYILRYQGLQTSFFDLYTLGEVLGAGHYAQVREARHRRTGAVHAVKIFQPQVAQSGTLAKLNQELELLMSMDHPNVVQLIDNFNEPVNRSSVVKYLVLEKVNGGELFQRVISKGKLRQDETNAIFRQLLQGLTYLHSKDIIHRDIKPENILLEITPRTDTDHSSHSPWDAHELVVTVKIADFGLAKCIGELNFTQTLCGTPAYVAPEVLCHSEARKYSKSVDLWSAGVLLYVCLCGFPPFSDELGPPSMRQQILEGKFAFFSPYWDEIADPALDLIARLLVIDPAERLTVEEASRHIWFMGKVENSERINVEVESMENTELEKIDVMRDIDSYREIHAKAMSVRIPVRSGTVPLTLSERYTSNEKLHSFHGATRGLSDVEMA